MRPKSSDDFSECVGPHRPCPRYPGEECFASICDTQPCQIVEHVIANMMDDENYYTNPGPPEDEARRGLSTDKDIRKSAPMARGLLDYFPDALFEVANLSWVATQQHHPDQPMHWDKSKSTDEADCIIRHLVERGTRDTDGIRHSTKVAWRALANLQREIEAERGK